MTLKLLIAPALCLLPLTACTLEGDNTEAADDATSSGSDASDDDATADTSDTSDPSDTSETGPGDDCPDENFPPVSADPANGAYADPYLAVHCEGDEVIVESNGIPAYEFVELTPNPLDEQDWAWHFPQFPTLAAQTSEVPLLGPVGTAVNGLPFYGPNEGPFPDPYGAVGCVDADCTDVVEYRSGWVQTGDPTTNAWDNYSYEASADPSVLDQCNGHVGPGGDYHYHATTGFPYILGCYAGTPTDNPGAMPGGMP